MMGSLGLVETQLRQYLFWAQRLEILGEKVLVEQKWRQCAEFASYLWMKEV
jgi:hypothetical protein